MQQIQAIQIRNIFDEDGELVRPFVSRDELVYANMTTADSVLSQNEFFCIALEYLENQGYSEDCYAKIDEIFY